MYTRILLFFVGIVFVSCRTSNSCDAYFSPVPVDKIKVKSSQDIKYETVSEYGIPHIDCKIRYDTKSHYTVFVTGHIVLRDIDQTKNFQIADTVTISEIIIKRKNHDIEYYSNKREESQNIKYKPWKEFPLPRSVSKKIRENFLLRMKYSKFHFKGLEGRGIIYTMGYKLWEPEE